MEIDLRSCEGPSRARSDAATVAIADVVDGELLDVLDAAERGERVHGLCEIPAAECDCKTELVRIVERRRDDRARTVRVLLTRKLADHLDDIDLSVYREGDVLDLPRREADVLIREGWAVAQAKRPGERPAPTGF